MLIFSRSAQFNQSPLQLLDTPGPGLEKRAVTWTRNGIGIITGTGNFELNENFTRQ